MFTKLLLALSGLVLTASSAVAESPDVPGNTSTTSQLVPDRGSVEGSIAGAGDQDWYLVQSKRRTHVSLLSTGQGGLLVEARTAAGKVLTSITLGSPYPGGVEFTIGSDRKYFVVVRAPRGSGPSCL